MKKNEAKGKGILAFAFGLATFIFATKGVLAFFWQDRSITGVIYFGATSLFAVLWAWTSISLILQNRKTSANKVLNRTVAPGGSTSG